MGDGGWWMGDGGGRWVCGGKWKVVLLPNYLRRQQDISFESSIDDCNI